MLNTPRYEMMFALMKISKRVYLFVYAIVCVRRCEREKKGVRERLKKEKKTKTTSHHIH